MMKAGWIVVGVLLLAAPPAFAQTMCNTRKGRDLWAEGTKYYNLQRWDDAIQAWEAAYLDCEDPELLFNLAQASRKGGHYVRARDFYRSWLRTVKNASAEDVALVNSKIEELDALIAAQKASSTSPPENLRPSDSPPPRETPAVEPPPAGQPPPAEPIDARSWTSDTWGWILVGGGATAMLAGGGLLLWSSSLAADADAEPDQQTAAGMFDDADALGTAGLVTASLGAAVVLGGIVHFALYEPDTRPRAVVSITPRSVSVAWTF